jgi:hypothetical protein
MEKNMSNTQSEETVFSLPSSSDEDVFLAGSTMLSGIPLFEGITDDMIIPHSWSSCDHESFHLRVGPNYKRNKAKAPSPYPFYEPVGFDFLKCKSRIDNIGSKVKIPEEWLDTAPNLMNLPPIFIVNTQLPSEFSSPFFGEVTDGDGWSLVSYFRLSDMAITAMESPETIPPALILLQKYCNEAPIAFAKHGISSSNPWPGRFKVSLRIENIENYGLPSFIAQYNAKPVLIRSTGFVHRADQYIEMDINVHKFHSLPKKALQVMFNRFETMVISMGFCIESREDEEMPETLLGCASINKPNPLGAAPWVPK